MGNRICSKRRSGIEERFTRPQRLIRQPSDVDYKRLRKLILSQKLAPCFDGVEDSHPDLEECPICFFYYPSLNRSTCCRKRVCTECFLQMKPSNASRPAQCPFCKCSSYAVEFRGAQTEEEKRKELAEEQKVIEAKMRIRRRESQNDQSLFVEQISSNEELQSSGPQHSAGDLHQVGGRRVEASTEQMAFQSPERRGAFNQDYEEIMIMEAIWRSLQEIDLQANTGEQSSASSGSGEAQDSNQNLSSTSLVGVGNLPGESVVERVAISIACTDEHGQSTITQTGQGPDSSSEVEYGDLKNETRSIADSRGEESEAGSEIECLASYAFTSDNDSWSLSHSIQEGSQNLLREVSSDADAADSSDAGSSLCSMHELSDRTPQYTDDEVEPCCSVLSSPVSH